jgi:hypothetical protein
MSDEMGRYGAKNCSKCVSIYLDGYLQSNIYVYKIIIHGLDAKRIVDMENLPII